MSPAAAARPSASSGVGPGSSRPPRSVQIVYPDRYSAPQSGQWTTSFIRSASTDVGASVHGRHALARELDSLPVPRFACEPPHLERSVARRLDPFLEHPPCRFRIVLHEVPLESHEGGAFLLRGQAIRKVEA